MDQALLQVGLPVKCRSCDQQGYVRPCTDYGGWYKSRLLRGHLTKRWFCPEHAVAGKEIDDRFYETYRDPTPEPVKENVEDELYKLLD